MLVNSAADTYSSNHFDGLGLFHILFVLPGMDICCKEIDPFCLFGEETKLIIFCTLSPLSFNGISDSLLSIPSSGNRF